MYFSIHTNVQIRCTLKMFIHVILDFLRFEFSLVMFLFVEFHREIVDDIEAKFNNKNQLEGHCIC